MNVQHKALAAGRWSEMPLAEQMANIGSEVSRAINWRKKGDLEYFRKAAERALELLDLSLDSSASFPKIREIARVREAVADFFFGSNQFSSSESSWRGYFDHFAYAVRKSRG